MNRSHRISVGTLGPIIQVGLNVGIDRADAGFGGPPISGIGLIDTGATFTAISNTLYNALRLGASGVAHYLRPGEVLIDVLKYTVRLKFEGHLALNPWFELDVVVVDPATPGIDVLIGMDLISQVALFYEGVNGTMIVTY